MSQANVLEINGERYVKSGADFNSQVDKVISCLGEDMYAALVDASAIIAGGAVLSAFTHQEINDIDVYFRSKESMAEAFKKVTKEWESVYLGHTDKSITLKDRDTEVIVQFIYFDYFEDPQAVFNAFDFTVCMAAVDLLDNKNELVIGDSFISDMSSRTLHFNHGTRFPYISLTRTKKYQERGYKIGKGNLISIAMACANKPILSWVEAKEQIGGVYGNQLELEVENYGLEDEEEFTQDRLIELTTRVKEVKYMHKDYGQIYKELTGENYF